MIVIPNAVRDVFLYAGEDPPNEVKIDGYKLSETNAPPGYIILTKDIYFNVANGTVTLTDENGDAKTYSDVSLLDNNTTIAVKNNIGASLPSTGGPGTTLFYLLGTILTAFAGAGLVVRKRRKT